MLNGLMRSEEDPEDHIKDGSPIKGDSTIPQIPSVIGLLNAVLHMHVHKSLDRHAKWQKSLSLFISLSWAKLCTAET